MVRREQSEAMRLQEDLGRARATTSELKTRLSEARPMLDKAAAIRAVLEKDLQEAETRNATLEEKLRHVRARRGELEQELQAAGGAKETSHESYSVVPLERFVGMWGNTA